MDREVARILDANFNRAREGLRVAEEFARFVVERRPLAERAKGFRHELGELARLLDPGGEMLSARDTAGDLGTQLSTEGEMRRASAGDVAVATAKRVGEALRVLCEFAKTVDAPTAGRLDQLRYRFYDWERDLSAAASRPNFAGVAVYLLLTEAYCAGGDWQGAARSAVDGGVGAIQLREKDLDGGEFLRRARWLTDLCRDAGVLSIINDRPDVARLADADGVHLGTGDLPAAGAREVLKSHQIIGVSTHNEAELSAALETGPDYVAVGPMFASATKPDYGVAGADYARQAIARLDAAGIPHVAVGGITPDNAAELAAAGVRCVAASQSILRADDMAEAVRAIRSALATA